MENLKCQKCNNNMLVMDNIIMNQHDDCLGGQHVVFENKDIETNIIYDIKITLNCINCECKSYYFIKNHKGLVKAGFIST